MTINALTLTIDIDGQLSRAYEDEYDNLRTITAYISSHDESRVLEVDPLAGWLGPRWTWIGLGTPAT